MGLYLGLIHYPVYNKNKETIASALTTVDIHDIARLGRTYCVKNFYVITPLEDQMMLGEKVRRHWLTGYGATYNHYRKEAMALVQLTSSLENAVSEIGRNEEEPPLLMATDAVEWKGRSISYGKARKYMFTEKPVLLLFGTAWGLHETILARSDHVLAPIYGSGDYNHLSVRAAAAIILDRLLGDATRPLANEV